MALAAGLLGISSASPALANVCSPFPSCIGAAPYQVSGTPDNSLSEWTNSPALSGSIVRSVSNGYTLWVVCQANDGPQEDGKYNAANVPSRTWDFTWDTGLSRYVWVYDWWMNTPAQNAADNWYSWPDAAHHCNFGTPPPQAPPTPTNVKAAWTTSGSIHITWQDNSGGGADYVVSNSSVSSPDLRAGTTSYDWPVPAGTYMCFTVTAKQNGLQSPWSSYGCTTTPTWCPTSDATKPSCSPGGAFQMDCNQPQCSQPTVDNNPPAPVVQPGDGVDAAEAEAAYQGMGAAGFIGAPIPDAQNFFGHYLGINATLGSDLNFDSTVPYFASTGTGSFSATVDSTVDNLINAANGGTGATGTFDSGWADYPAVGVDTTAWNDDDWRYATGHGFFRVTGTRQSGGGWSVSLQWSSYYQFRDNVNFGPVSGTDMRRLEAIGWAQNYDEVGNGTLLYSSSGQEILRPG